MRKLATIQKIKAIRPIPKADNIEVADVLGWHVVVLKDEYKVGDLCIYCEIDSIMPEDNPVFEFLKNSKGKIERLRTVRLRGQISQGIVFSTDILPEGTEVIEGADVTELLHIKKYEAVPQHRMRRYRFPFIPSFIHGFMSKHMSNDLFTKLFLKPDSMSFPAGIHKTNEVRVQVSQEALSKYKGTKCYASEKINGASITVYLKDGKLHICSHDLELLEDPIDMYWRTANALYLKEKLKTLDDENIVLQGELAGEGIAHNTLKLQGRTIFFFDVYNRSTEEYYTYHDFVALIEKLGLKTVPIITEEFILTDNVDDLIKYSEGMSLVNPSVLREGVVIRPIEETRDFDTNIDFSSGRVSFKAVNPKYLLKNKEE